MLWEINLKGLEKWRLHTEEAFVLHPEIDVVRGAQHHINFWVIRREGMIRRGYGSRGGHSFVILMSEVIW